MVTGWQYQRFSAIFPIFPRIGIDSIGGVRVPGGYCRLLAFRLSHVVISNSGVTRIAPSLDTIDTSTYILKRSRMTRKQLMYQDVQNVYKEKKPLSLVLEKNDTKHEGSKRTL
ncbi:uncharacterized protein LOC123426005 isoform X2 [Hordeum vulgare subsp. vulgare]|uniref:uncharacterized protein LOC123426005 isoform X2 n=1 Tax=Hordeum vulgare subsp. vulgare TaxID=112509 RepID=UPI000B463E4C|nr:uncharacterized protein LOC123426005 isoform X2 [Hordeum vulgare subsp. vulgare]